MIAIIPAAGLGSRFLPLTKAQPKEMLPVVDKPVIQYVVEEAIAAGADEVVIVNNRSKRSIEEHFAPAPALVDELRSRGKDAYAKLVEDAGNLPVSFVYQDEPLGLGHAVLMAADHAGDESFFILLGDMIVPGGGILERMRAVHERHGAASVVAVFPVPNDEVSRYGIIAGEPVEGEEGVWRVERLVEKPPVEEAPSNLAIFGRYLLTPLVMRLLADEPAGVGGEIQLTGALDGALANEEMYALVIDPDEGFDTGTVASWLETNMRLALHDEALAPVVRSISEGQA